MATSDSAKKRDEFSGAKDEVDAALANNQLPSCALDEAGIREQQARQRRLAPSVVNVGRRDEALLIAFAEGYDRQALEEMVAVERQCCPFFEFDFDEGARELRVGVREREMLPALEALASHLDGEGGAQSATRPTADGREMVSG